MDKYLLVMKWEYEYDKEGTWFDEDSGENRFELKEGASHPLPHEDRIKVEIRSVARDGDGIKAEVYVDCHTLTVSSGGEAVTSHASNSYCVCGDSVHESWCLSFTVERE